MPSKSPETVNNSKTNQSNRGNLRFCPKFANHNTEH